jgi:hypothetical protein
MPSGTICLTQQEANVAASNAREVIALRKSVAERDEGLKAKDVTIAELKETNARNVTTLTNRINEVTAEAALEKGRREQLEADKVFWSKVIEAAMNNTRKKCVVSILFC